MDTRTAVSMIERGNPEERERAVFELAANRHPEAIRLLSNTLNNPDPGVRWSAIQAAWRIGGAEAVQMLISRLQDESDLVRRGAAVGLGELRDSKALHPLFASLEDQDPGVRMAAALALARFGAAIVPRLLSLAVAHPAVGDLVDHCFRAMGSACALDAVEPLTEGLRNPSPQLRTFAAQALSHFDDDRAERALHAATSDPDARVRQVADVSWRLVRARKSQNGGTR